MIWVLYIIILRLLDFVVYTNYGYGIITKAPKISKISEEFILI